MIRHHDIPWFNPRQMDDATVRALCTGRETLLLEFFLLARQRLREPAAGKHWLVLGPRGAGKSFFLRLVQCRFAEAMNLDGKTASIVLLPEEQPNVFSPHEWLVEVQRLLPGQTRTKGQSPVWQVKDEATAWQTALQSLLDTFKGDLLVIAVENFDQLLAQAFDNDVRASRLRNLMENEPRIMLLASAVEGDFDEAYDKRLFRQFEHHPMPRWNEHDHRDYLTRRAKLQDKEPTNRQLAKIDAYSRFTGGSARTAAVLAASILDEQDPLSASHDLMATLDRMSDYYRALIEKMPTNTRKVFDNLVRGGEPASQVELANRIQARQSDISKAFRWLTDYGYVINEKQPGSKEHSYRVSDRLFVQFYRMRYIDPDQPCQLAILADLLAATIEFPNKWQFAESYLDMEKHAEAELMAQLACEERGVDVNLLPEGMRDAKSLIMLGREWVWVDRFEFDSPEAIARVVQEYLGRFQSEEDMKRAYQAARHLATAVIREDRQGIDLVEMIEKSSELPPIYMLIAFVGMFNSSINKFDWRAMEQVCATGAAQIEYMINATPGFTAYLEREHGLARDYPLAVTLTSLVEGHASAQAWTQQFKPTNVVRWAARATRLWYEHGEAGKAFNSFESYYKMVEQLLDHPYKPSDALDALQILTPVEGLMAEKVKGGYYFQLALCFEELEQHIDAISAFTKLRQIAPKSQKLKVSTWGLQKIAQHHWEAGCPQEALQVIEKALEESISDGDFEAVAWSLGLKARVWLSDHDINTVWEFITVLDQAYYQHMPLMMSNIGLAIWDRYISHGEAKAFGFARELLREVAIHADFIKHIWGALIDRGVPLPLLRDLVRELPNITSESEGSIGFEHAQEVRSTEITGLGTALEIWLDYLAATPEQRSHQLRRLDPDLAATLEGLSKNLSPKAKHRFGLQPSTANT